MGDIPYFTPPEQPNTCFDTTMQETSTNLVWAHLKSVQYCFNILNSVKPCYLQHKVFLHLENIKHPCQHSKILKLFRFRSTAKAFGLHLGTLSPTQLVWHFFLQMVIAALQAYQIARKKMASDFLNNKKLYTYARWIGFCVKINHLFVRGWTKSRNLQRKRWRILKLQPTRVDTPI